MDVDRSQTGGMAPLDEWANGSTDVTLQVSASDARRIVRALEETSVRLSGSPSGSRLAGSYIRLAAIVRSQTAAPIKLAG